MKVFLSWSGERSKKVAEAFRDWLPQIIQAVDPWMSKSSIEKGERSAQAIADQLEDTKVGIVCLTSDNLRAPWVLYESGAIAKTNDARLCTFLLDVKNADVEPPLGHFQSTAFDATDVFSLAETILTKVRAGKEILVARADVRRPLEA